MTLEVSQPRYGTETAFRREIERRFGDSVPDEIWDVTGGSMWRDQEIERGYAVQAAIRSVLVELRHRRTRRQLPPAPAVIRGEPRDAWKWRLRSLLASRLVQEQVTEWRRLYLPRVLRPQSFTHSGPDGGIVVSGRSGPLRTDEFKRWVALLIARDGRQLIALPRANGGPDIPLAGTRSIRLSFPSAIRPRFLDGDAGSRVWWSGWDSRSDEEIGIDAASGTGQASRLRLNYWGKRTLETLASEAKRMRTNRWTLAEISGLFLFGEIPALSPMIATRSLRLDRLGWTQRVTLSIDSRVNPEDVASFYRDIVHNVADPSTLGSPIKGFSVRVGTLVEFVLREWSPEHRPDWKMLWHEWQEKHQADGSGYSSARTMQRVFERALGRLSRESR